MKLPQEFLEAAHQEEVEEIMERGVKLGHFERKIGRRSVKSYRSPPGRGLGRGGGGRVERMEPMAQDGPGGPASPCSWSCDDRR